MAVALVRLLLWLASICPPRLGWLFCRAGARLLVALRTETVRTSIINLRLCFPDLDDSAVTRLARESVSHMLFLFFEFAYQANWSETRLMSQVSEIDGQEVLDSAYDQERGVLLLTPHYGNWELLCVYLGANYHFSALYDPPKMSHLEPVVRSVRERFQAELFPIDTGGMRNFLKVLRQGYIAGILPDQVPSRSAGVYADFFGHPALTMTLPHRMFTRNNPVPIIGWVSRDWGDHGLSYCLHFRDISLQIDPRDELAKQQSDCAQAINAAIEELVRVAPAQYQWEYKRFKRPPEGGRTNVYRRQ